MAHRLGSTEHVTALAEESFTAHAPPTRRASAAYAAGSFGTGVFSTVPAVILLYFCTEILALPAAWATVIVFVPKIWSVLWDPWVGSWSDRTITRIGRRRPFMIIGTLGMPFAFVAMFSPPPLAALATAVWVGVTYFLLATFYSLFAVPYVAIPAELIDNRDERARLIAWRMFVVMLGILTGAGLVPWLATFFGGGRTGYASMSVGVAIACAVAMTGPLFMLRGRDVARSSQTPVKSQSVRSAFQRALQDRSFLRLGLAYLLLLSASGAVTSAVPYFVKHFFGRSDGEIGTALFVMLIATTATVAAWGRLGRRHGELRTLQVAVLVYALTALAIGALALLHAPWSFALVGFALLGVPFGAMQVLPYTLVANLIHGGSAHADSAEGTLTGIWTATEKLGLALGPTITGLVLSMIGTGDHPALPALTITTSALLMAASIAVLHSLRSSPGGSAQPHLAR